MLVLADSSTTVLIGSFTVYTLAIVGVGLYSSRYAEKSDEDYFLAGRTLGPWIAAMSASASSESGWVTLGLVGWAFTSGVQAYWIIPGCLCGFLFNWLVIAGPLNDQSRQLGALTITDYFSMRFRERVPLLRILSVVVILTAMMLYVAAQFAAAGKSFAAISDSISYPVGVIIGSAIVLFYTISGGFRAACWTDFVQALLMVGCLAVFPIYMLFKLGGWGPALSPLSQVSPNFLSMWPEATGLAFVGFLLGAGALGINFGYPGQPHVLVRFMSLKNRKEAVVGGVISFVWGLLVYAGAVTVGLLARSMAVQGESWAQEMVTVDGANELALVRSAMHMLPGVLSGLVLAAVLAAICSTADSQLVVAGSSTAVDIYSRLVDRSGKTAHMFLNRFTILALGVVAILLVIDEEVKVYQFVLSYGWAVLGASFGPQLILALFWKRASYAGCIAGMLAGFVVAIGWMMWTDNKLFAGTARQIEVYNLPLAFVVAALVNVVVSLISGPTPRQGDAFTAT